MKKSKTSFFCQHCGYMSPKWLGKCPSCSGWNCFAEELVTEPDSVSRADRVFGGKPMPIFDIPAVEGERTSTGIVEVDRVLGGGIVSGSAILIGGEPGIGKSTLMLQVMKNLAMGGRKVLYVSGEESASQIKLRADRIGAQAKDLLVLVEVSLEKILEQIRKTEPAMVVIDSVQTVYSSDLMSAPGSVGQVREASSRLILAAKKSSIPVFLVGHVTKDGSIAGPKVLEHMVDTVLYFEGDSGHAYRIVRSMKPVRPANEIGVFEMRDRGLQEVPNPLPFPVRTAGKRSRQWCGEPRRHPSDSCGDPGAGEPVHLGMPRRTAIGWITTRCRCWWPCWIKSAACIWADRIFS